MDAYEDLLDTRPMDMPTTRGDPRTIYAKTSAYHNSFVLKTIREFKANLNKVSVNQ